MRAFLMALFLGLSTASYAQDPEPVAEEAATEEAAPADEGTPAAAPAEEAAEPEAAAEGDEPKADEPKGEAKPEAAEAEGEKPELTDEEALESVGLLVEALQNGQWPLAFGLLLTLLVYAASRFGLKDLVGTKALPWVTMGVAVAGTVGAGLLAGLEVTQVLTQGVLAGVAAIGGWELLLKHMLPKEKPAEEPKAEEPKAEEPAAEEPKAEEPAAEGDEKTDPGASPPAE